MIARKFVTIGRPPVLNSQQSIPQRKSPPKSETGPLPFFHPTRVVFVDDDPGFLRYFPESLGAHIPISRYASARQLLSDLAQGRLETSIQLDCWSSDTDRFTDPDYEHMLSLDKTVLMNRVFARHRFDPVSVMVVDYDMPEMDGLALCRRLAHLPCRKILLTGQASEAQAVAAFNEGLIDYFLPKGASDRKTLLRERVQRYQRAFIADATELVRQALRTETLMTWDDPEFCALFAHLREVHGVVEYYAISDPAEGFLLVNAAGEGRLLLTYNGCALDSQLMSARLLGAPRDVVSALELRRAATFFCDERSDMVLDAPAWRLACVPVLPFPTGTDRYYALIDTCNPFDVSPRTVVGLRRYLEELV
jgi:CheY-like chemotaxis protein